MISATYFDDMYRTPSPALERRFHDARKRALTLAALPLERYALAFEPGCGAGLMTHELAARCDRVIAADFSPLALKRARRHLDPSIVELRQLHLPGEWPDERFDLIVASELLYCLDPDELGQFYERMFRSLRAGGHLVLAHSRNPPAEYPLDAERVHEGLLEIEGWKPLAGYADTQMLIDVYEAGMESS